MTQVDGVGQKEAQLLAKGGVTTVKELATLLCCKPRLEALTTCIPNIRRLSKIAVSMLSAADKHDKATPTPATKPVAADAVQYTWESIVKPMVPRESVSSRSAPLILQGIDEETNEFLRFQAVPPINTV